MRKASWFFVVVVVFLFACSKEPIQDEKRAVPATAKVLSDEERSIQLFHQFLDGLKEDATTKSSSEHQIVKVNKTSASAYHEGIAKAMTRSSTHDLPLYELTLQNSDQSRGFAVVACDDRVGEVVAYVPVGALSDTAHIEPMAFYFRALAENLVAMDSSEITNPVVPSDPNVQLHDYWQPIIGAFANDPGATPQVLANYYSYADFMAAGGLYYRADPVDYRDTKMAKVPTLWGQSWPYNLFVPVKYRDSRANENCNVGCFAVALGQLMAYWQRPVGYNWGLLTRSSYINSSSSSETLHAVSTLLTHLANRGGTYYDAIANQGATPIASVTPTLNTFGYQVNHIDYGTSPFVTDLIYNEMIHGRPCLASGQASEGGHIWVVDGVHRLYRWYYWSSSTSQGGNFVEASLYRIRQRYSMIHCNWGWHGMSNGWYAALNPYHSQYGKELHFTENHTLWYGISPR